MAALLRAACLVIASMVFLLPAAASAASVFWGFEDGDPAQIELVDGGTYAVPFDTPAPFYYADTVGLVVVTLYKINPTEEGEEKVFIIDFDRPNAEDGFAWTEPGVYEVVFDPITPMMQVHSSPAWRFARLFGRIAEAQTPSSPFVTIRFTIEELVAEPECPDAAADGCYSNVLFLPGIEASRLYSGAEKLWEPGGDDDIEALFLNIDGESVDAGVYTKDGDVLDELPFIGANIYKSFIAEMDALVAEGQIADWQATAYDWRLSLDDILASGAQEDENIFFTTATNTPYIIQELRRLAASSKSGKVTVVAHSNGGLLAKRLTQVLGEEAVDLIDKMILVASPQAGTPDAVAIALHGEKIGPFGIAGSAAAVRTFAGTSPMLYHLLPSERYFTHIDDPVVSFDPELEEWIARYGDVIHSEERLHAFLIDSYGRVDARNGAIDQPVQLHEALLLDAEALHDELDIWQPPNGVELIQIAGWGVPTVAGIRYSESKTGDITSGPEFDVIDGDGRVLVPSALWTSTPVAQNYWFNLNAYNRNHRLATLNGLLPFNHANILETDRLRMYIKDEILNQVAPISTYTYLALEAPPSILSRLRFELHSPLTLDLYDGSGNHTGVSTTTGEVVEGIPGTYYITFGEQQYIFADAGTGYTLALDGYDEGTFTLVITETEGDTPVSSITFADVPVTPETVVTLSVPTDIDEIAEISVDEDGDGEIDFTVSEDGTVHEVSEPEEEPEQPAVVIVANGPPVASQPSAPTTGASAGGGVSAPIAPTTTPVLATSTGEVATSTAEEPQAVSQREEREEGAEGGQRVQKQKSVAPPKPVTQPVREEAAVVAKPLAQEQVAAAAQVTQGGLWKRIYRWILIKLGR